MSIEITVLVEDVTADGDSTVRYSEPTKGSGYHLKDGTHTMVYRVSDFEGSIMLQGTLEQYPGEEDWANISETAFTGDQSSMFNQTFFGNYVWIRAAYQIQSGSIEKIVVSV